MIKNWNYILKNILQGERDEVNIKSCKDFLKQLGIKYDHMSASEIYVVSCGLFSSIKKTCIRSVENKVNLSGYETVKEQNLSNEAAMQLKSIMDAKELDLLKELLGIIDQKKLVAPAFLLPSLLDLGYQNRALRPKIARLIGKRGQWLAEKRDKWSIYKIYFTSDWEKLFDKGTTKERMFALKKTRFTSKSLHIRWVKKCWEDEHVKTQLKILETFGLPLTDEDIDFLSQHSQEAHQSLKEPMERLLLHYPASVINKTLLTFIEQGLIINEDCIEVSTNIQQCTTPYHWLNTYLEKESNETVLFKILCLVNPILLETLFKIKYSDLLSLAQNSESWKYLSISFLQSSSLHNAESWLMQIHRIYLENNRSNWLQEVFQQLYETVSYYTFNCFLQNSIQVNRHQIIQSQNKLYDILMVDDKKWDLKNSISILNILIKTMDHNDFTLNWGLKAMIKKAAYALNPAVLNDPELYQVLQYNRNADIMNCVKTLKQRASFYNI